MAAREVAHWPLDCRKCGEPTAPWNPYDPGAMTHIVPGGGPDWDRNKDHEPLFTADEIIKMIRQTGQTEVGGYNSEGIGHRLDHAQHR